MPTTSYRVPSSHTQPVNLAIAKRACTSLQRPTLPIHSYIQLQTSYIFILRDMISIARA